eukprot:5391499-Pleurochrysis_carterae.AAC.3
MTPVSPALPLKVKILARPALRAPNQCASADQTRMNAVTTRVLSSSAVRRALLARPSKLSASLPEPEAGGAGAARLERLPRLRRGKQSNSTFRAVTSVVRTMQREACAAGGLGGARGDAAGEGRRTRCARWSSLLLAWTVRANDASLGLGGEKAGDATERLRSEGERVRRVEG